MECPMTLNGLQGHSPIASLVKCSFFSYCCAAVDTVATDNSMAHRPSMTAELLVWYTLLKWMNKGI